MNRCCTLHLDNFSTRGTVYPSSSSTTCHWILSRILPGEIEGCTKNRTSTSSNLNFYSPNSYQIMKRNRDYSTIEILDLLIRIKEDCDMLRNICSVSFFLYKICISCVHCSRMLFYNCKLKALRLSNNSTYIIIIVHEH